MGEILMFLGLFYGGQILAVSAYLYFDRPKWEDYDA
jgi:hypothetical protein